jgi:hypothetical protein
MTDDGMSLDALNAWLAKSHPLAKPVTREKYVEVFRQTA